MDIKEKALKQHEEWQGKIEVNCEFCEKNYEFTADDVEEMFKNEG